MDSTNNIETKELKIQDSFEVIIDSRGALGLQLLYRVDNSDIVEVTKAGGEASSTNPPSPGNAIAASFTIKALKAGSATITFYETRPWEKNFADIIKKQVRVQVSN